MWSLIRYTLISLIKSYKYVPPLTVYVITLVMVYDYRPNPIFNSYMLTSILLYLIMTWITITIFNGEDIVQQQITVFHANSLLKYFFSKYVSTLIIGSLLSILSTLYPIIFNEFNSEVSAFHVLLGLLTHLCLTYLSICIAALFSRGMISHASNQWLGLLLTDTIFLALPALRSYLPEAIFILFPPITGIMQLTGINDNLNNFSDTFFFNYFWAFLYGLPLIFIFYIIVRTKRKYL